jgi:drug/metabolite transporter (DMT)-like permease
VNSSGATNRLAAYASLGLSVVFFAAVPLFIKHLAGGLDAWTVNGVRYAVACTIWLPYVARNARHPQLRPLLRAALLPSAVNLIGQVLWGLTPYYASASEIGFVVRTSFLFTLLAGLVWLPSERPLARSAGFWTGVAVSIAGVCLMYAPSLAQAGGASAKGLAVILATALFWGLYSVTISRCLRGYSSRLSFGVICLYTSAGLLVAMLLQGHPGALRTVGARDLAILAVSGYVGIAFSHVLLYRAIHTLGAIAASGANLVMPFLTWLGAWLILGEAMTQRQWQGGMVVVAGTVLLLGSQWRFSRRAAAAETPDVAPLASD